MLHTKDFPFFAASGQRTLLFWASYFASLRHSSLSPPGGRKNALPSFFAPSIHHICSSTHFTCTKQPVNVHLCRGKLRGESKQNCATFHTYNNIPDGVLN